MTDNDLEKVRAALAAAIQVPQEMRPAIVRELCLGDQHLISEVEALLHVHLLAGEFLDRPMPELLGAKQHSIVDLPAGTVLKGRYQIERKVAQSDFATVYFAADQLIGEKRVVIKVPDQLQDETTLQATFASELRSLSRVQHPNVVGITDVGTLEDGKPFLVLTYVPGVTLRDVIRRGPLSKTRVNSIVQGIGRALAAAHKEGVWHLDLKPENIIVTELDTNDERITLIDFGIARLKNTQDGFLIAGSPRYMAPEQHEHASARCDIYSLSLIAFELFTGHLPTKTRALAEQLPRKLGRRTTSALITGLSALPAERFSEVFQFVEELHGARKKNLAVILAPIGVILIVATAIYSWFTRSPVRQSYTKSIPIVSTPDREHQPVFSPDGTEVYYAAGPEGRQDIYKKAIAGGDAVLVVGHPADDARPRVSPDGKQITFVRHNGKRADLILKRLSDSQEEVLVAGLDIDTHSWTPDGKRLVLSAIGESGVQRLRVVAIATRKITALEIPNASNCDLYHPRVSPDGQMLAFSCRWFPGSDDLFIVQIDADVKPVGTARRITKSRDRIDALEWAPDGQSLLYVAGPLGNGLLWRVFPNTRDDPSVVPGTPDRIESLAIASHRWEIAYTHHLSDTNIWRYDSDLAGPARQVAASSYEDEEGSLSPDGRFLLFDSDRSGKPQIWVANADGKNARQLTNLQSLDGIGALWARNAKDAIVSARSKDLGERVYRISVEGPPTLTPVLQGGIAASVSRDGRRLYIAKRAGVMRNIFRTQYPEAKTTEMVAEGGAYGVESTDGRFFYFVKRDEHEGIWRRRLPDGPITQVVRQLHRRDLFAVGKLGLFYIAPIQGTQFPSLFFLSFQTDTAKKLFSFEQGIGWGLDLSPDERTLLLSQEDVGNSDIMLIERFR